MPKTISMNNTFRYCKSNVNITGLLVTLALISNIANYLKYNYFWDSDGIDNVTLRLWKFSDFCSRHIVGVAGDDIMFHILVIIIKSEVSTFPIVIIFFRGCVSKMFVTLYSVTYCIYIPGKLGNGFHYYCAVYDVCKWSDTFCLEEYIYFVVSSSSNRKYELFPIVYG